MTAKLTPKEQRLKDAAQRASEDALASRQALNERERQFEKLCDDLCQAGNTGDQLRAYWPDYKTPEERESE